MADRPWPPVRIAKPFSKTSHKFRDLTRIVVSACPEVFHRPDLAFNLVWNQSRTLQYPFMVIELRLDSQGRGEGKMTVATKLDADKDGQIVLENYGSQPVRLGGVKRDDRQLQEVR